MNPALYAGNISLLKSSCNFSFQAFKYMCTLLTIVEIYSGSVFVSERMFQKELYFPLGKCVTNDIEGIITILKESIL